MREDCIWKRRLRAHTVCNVGNELNGKTLGLIAHIIIFIELRMHIVIVHLRVL